MKEKELLIEPVKLKAFRAQLEVLAKRKENSKLKINSQETHKSFLEKLKEVVKD